MKIYVYLVAVTLGTPKLNKSHCHSINLFVNKTRLLFYLTPNKNVHIKEENHPEYTWYASESQNGHVTSEDVYKLVVISM